MVPRNAWGAGGAEEDEMGIDRTRGFDVTTSERILAGEDVGPRDLVNLLAAAAAPARGSETAGEEAAVMAFRAARHRPAKRGNRKPVVVRWATLLGAKTVAAIAVAVAATGAALAAGTGVLPNPFVDPEAPSSPAVTGSSHAGTGSGVPTSVPPSSHPGPPSTAGGPPPTVPAAVIGMCQAYLAQEEKEPGSAAGSPAFATLIAAAGGAANVPAYCEAALAQQDPSFAPPTPSAHPTGPPEAPPTPAQGGGENSYR